MLGTILKIYTLLQGIWAAFQYIAEAWRARQIRKAEEKRQRLEQALKDTEKAKTPKDAWDAQERITDNEP